MKPSIHYILQKLKSYKLFCLQGLAHKLDRNAKVSSLAHIPELPIPALGCLQLKFKNFKIDAWFFFAIGRSAIALKSKANNLQSI